MSSAAAPHGPPPQIRHKVGTAAAPGDRLGPYAAPAPRGGCGGGARLVPGGGTYARRGHIVACVAGTVSARRLLDDHDDGGGGGRWAISVVPERRPSSPSRGGGIRRPGVGSVVLGRVTRVSRPSHASVDIIAAVPPNEGAGGGRTRRIVVPYREPHPGILRQGEMRPKSSLDVRVEECVRPGDVVLARVHADGERDYILSTAEAELGVVRAVCEGSGQVMEPVSWKEMRCPVTGARERRKVAKPRSA
jgi:exosome complex component CSL4